MTRRDFLKRLAGSMALAGMPFVQTSCASKKSQPNIIYILADDLGYGDISALNPDSRIKTSHIDRLANEGVSFTDTHSGSAVCTPTRYGVLTGRYAWRTRLKEHVLWSYDPALIDTHRMTVASLLQAQGYRTGCIGKWHLGWDWSYKNETDHIIDFEKPISNGPTAVGFDHFFGILASLDIPPYVYVENDRVTALPDRRTENTDPQGFWRSGLTGADFEHEQVLPTLTQKATAFIEQHADQPFFLYFPLTAPHTPILPLPEYQNKSGTNVYGDFVLQVDDIVGSILDTLDRLQLAENTLIIFTSDNGCSPRADFPALEAKGHDPSYIYRGHKADIFEGGHRIPFIIRWPAQVPAGRTCASTLCLTDLMATCAEMLQVEYPADAAEDSFSFLSLLLEPESDEGIRPHTIHHSVNGSFAIRQGKWKLVCCPGSGGWSPPKPGSQGIIGLPPFQLYDLENDPQETNNLYEQHPEIVKAMTLALLTVIENGRSTPGPEQPNDPAGSWPQVDDIKSVFRSL